MSEGLLSIDDIIYNNTDQSQIPVKPKEIIKPSYILLIHHETKKKVIIYTGAVLNETPDEESKSYYLKETLDDGTEIYSKPGELTDIIKCEILSDIGYTKPSEGCTTMGGKRKRKRTKKNKKRKSKKCKSKRRMRK